MSGIFCAANGAPLLSSSFVCFRCVYSRLSYEWLYFYLKYSGTHPTSVPKYTYLYSLEFVDAFERSVEGFLFFEMNEAVSFG